MHFPNKATLNISKFVPVSLILLFFFLQPLIENATLSLLRKFLLVSPYNETVQSTAILYNIACMPQNVFRQTLFETTFPKILVSMLDYTDALMDICRVDMWKVFHASAWEWLEQTYRDLPHSSESEQPDTEESVKLPDDVDESAASLASSSESDYTLDHPWQFFYEQFPQMGLRRIRHSTVRSEGEMMNQGLEAVAILNLFATNIDRCKVLLEYHVMDYLCRFGCNFQAQFPSLSRPSLLFPFFQFILRLLYAGENLARRQQQNESDSSSESPAPTNHSVELSESETSRVLFMNVPLATLMSNNYYSLIAFLLSNKPYNVTIDQKFQTAAVTFNAKPKTKEEYEEQLFSVISCLNQIQHKFIDEYQMRSQDADGDMESNT